MRSPDCRVTICDRWSASALRGRAARGPRHPGARAASEVAHGARRHGPGRRARARGSRRATPTASIQWDCDGLNPPREHPRRRRGGSHGSDDALRRIGERISALEQHALGELRARLGIIHPTSSSPAASTPPGTTVPAWTRPRRRSRTTLSAAIPPAPAASCTAASRSPRTLGSADNTGEEFERGLCESLLQTGADPVQAGRAGPRSIPAARRRAGR